jgi:hypothetical protein
VERVSDLARYCVISSVGPKWVIFPRKPGLLAMSGPENTPEVIRWTENTPEVIRWIPDIAFRRSEAEG